MGRMTTRGLRALALVLVALSAAQSQTSCPEGMYRAWVGDWCCNSKCGPGTRIVHSCSNDDRDDTACEPCGPDYYNPSADQLHCNRKKICNGPYQEIKIQGSATADNECQCQIGHYSVDTLCLHGPECPPGRGVTRTGHCEVCLHGTFSNITSRIQPCLPWQRCPLGYTEGRPGTNVSDVICTSHPLDWLFNTNSPDVIIVESIRNDTQSHRENEKGGLPSSTVSPMAVGICAVLAVVIGIVVVICRHRQGQQKDKKGDAESSATGSTIEEDVLLQPIQIEATEQPTVMEQTVANNNEMATFTELPVEATDNPGPSATNTFPKLVLATLLPDPNTITANEDTTDYIEQHLGDDYLDFARGLPVPEGCEFTRTDLDSLKHTYIIHGPREAIRETMGFWKSKHGDRATLGGLLQGLSACGRDGMARELCDLNHVH
ncbi:tumor necrosis factor receptor superfamily member 16-like [Branchiostoma lanceolatum]|uniref:tumor necrosis factor receptor superfamily member 16-like n=1 Tax=Branchiostoma lanceolatum TaxID=7740 RepID=UPI003452C28C